jgi:hypothetical protein
VLRRPIVVPAQPASRAAVVSAAIADLNLMGSF